MDFGMPTLIENRSIEETASLCKELGLKFIELNMNLPQYQCEDLENIDKFKRVQEAYNIYFTLHLDENLDVCCYNSEISSAWIRTVKRTIDIAKLLDIKVINMHMNQGVHITLPTEKVFLYERYESLYLDKVKQFSDFCEMALGTSDTVICIENTNGYTQFQKKGIELLLQIKQFALTWDIGHSHAVNDMDEEFILNHSDRLLHMHVHDCLGKMNHLTLGTGEINLHNRLNTARMCGCRCVLETKTISALKESVQWVQREIS